MDLRHYFRKIREAEEALVERFPLVTSIETSDGGKDGFVTEVTKTEAARLIVEGKARLSTETERSDYLAAQIAARAAAEKAEFSKRLQVAIVTESDLDKKTVSKK